jgi:hypothetical protein
LSRWDGIAVVGSFSEAWRNGFGTHHFFSDEIWEFFVDTETDGTALGSNDTSSRHWFSGAICTFLPLESTNFLTGHDIISNSKYKSSITNT